MADHCTPTTDSGLPLGDRLDASGHSRWLTGQLGVPRPDDQTLHTIAPAEHVVEKFYEAIAGYADLQRSSEIMQSSIENGTGLKRDQAQSALAANKKAMRSIKDFLDSCLASFPMRYRPTRNSHLKAQQVLSTPELLEAILFELPPFELLGAVRINRATFQIFKDSPRLLDRLQLRRRKGGHFSNSISDGFPGLPINTSNLGGMFSDYEYSRGEFENVGVEINVKRRADLAIGSRCRSMLVIRPHVTSMIVCLSCCFSPPTDLRDPFNLSFRDADSDDDVTVAPPTYPPPPPFPPSSQLLPLPPPPPLPFLPPSAPLLGASSAALAEPAEAETTAEALRAVEAPKAPHDTSHNESDRNAAVADTYKIVCKAGITVSHIVDAVQRLREAHRTCPNASIEEHGPDGIVKPSITFRARLKLKNDDPFLAQKDREDTFGQLRRISKYDNDSQILQLYIRSKKRASKLGWPILTFEEFKANYDVDDITGAGDLLPDPSTFVPPDFPDLFNTLGRQAEW